MNKVGLQFLYSYNYIQFLTFLKIDFKISYRTVQGIVRGLSENLKIKEIHVTPIKIINLKIKQSVGNLDFEDDDL